MNHAIPSNASQHAVPPVSQPTPGYRNEQQNATGPAPIERSHAQTDDRPDAILGYN